MATILIVDDHSVHREFLMALLAGADHQLLQASDGLEALELAASCRPDLVITDIMMPRMDGYQLVSRMRQDPALAQTPVMFYTSSYSSAEASAMARSCGVRWVLPKPAPPQLILNGIHEALQLPLPPPASALAVPARHFASIDQALVRDLYGNGTGVAPVGSELPMDYQSIGLRLTALIDMGIELASERDPQSLLENGCRIARHIGVARMAVAALLDADGPECAHFTTRGMTPEAEAAIHGQLPSGTAFADALAQRRPQRLHGAQLTPQRIGLPPGHPDLDSLLIVPIASPRAGYGWIYLADKLGADRFSAVDEEVLAAVASQMAVAYENSLLLRRTAAQVLKLEQEAAERKAMALLLQQSEVQFRQLAENINEVFFLLNAEDQRVLYVSPAYERIWGRSCASLYADPAAWQAAIHADDLAAVSAIETARQQPGAVRGFDYRYRIAQPDGALRMIHARGFPILDADGAVYRIAGIAEDITAAHDQQQKLTRLSRIHAVQSGINAAIVRARDRPSLLRAASQVAIEQGAFSMAWLGLIGERSGDGGTIGWLTDPARQAEQEALLRAAMAAGAGHPACVAAREARSMVCNDIASEPALATTSAALCSGGHRSMVALPLLVDGRAVAIMTLFAAEPGFFDGQQLALLEDLAADLSYGLSHIDKEERLHFLAYYDALTGLPNRTLFLDRLNQRLLGRTHDIAVVVLNLDRFSQLNDAMGRKAGDAVLRMVAERLSLTLGERACVARLVNDTYALLLDNASERHAVIHVEAQVLDVIEAEFELDGSSLRISARAGMATAPGDGSDAETLLKCAELALKGTKAAQVRALYYAARMNAASAAQLELESALYAALESGQFVLHYQPRVDLLSGRIVSAEALIRWQHPRRGLVGPGHFISLCEETGLIVPISDWVIDQVCAQQAHWRQAGIGIVPVAVNLSALHFRKGDLLQTIAAALARHGLEQHYLEFELTESMVMADLDQAEHDLRMLRATGAKLSLDDFGTGYSSLAYLQRLPFDYVKIDRSFVANLTSSPADAAIVGAVIAVAHSLQLEVVAEGVETEGQLRALRRLRCDQLQGYLFSPGVAAEEFGAMLGADKQLAPPESAGTGGETVLVVDDEPNNLAALNRLLRAEGYQILLAASGQEGLDLLACNEVQVVISDQRMPEMSGTQFLAIVKQLYPQTIRIILSGYTDLEVVTESVNRGAVFKFLTKPWDNALLRGHIREAFRLAQAPGAAP